jgi:hypothetical protein
VFTDPLPSNRRPIVARIGLHGNVFTESLPNNGSKRHNILISICICELNLKSAKNTFILKHLTQMENNCYSKNNELGGYRIQMHIWVRLRHDQCEFWCSIILVFAASSEILGSVEERAQVTFNIKSVAALGDIHSSTVKSQFPAHVPPPGSLYSPLGGFALPVDNLWSSRLGKPHGRSECDGKDSECIVPPRIGSRKIVE